MCDGTGGSGAAWRAKVGVAVYTLRRRTSVLDQDFPTLCNQISTLTTVLPGPGEDNKVGYHCVFFSTREDTGLCTLNYIPVMSCVIRGTTSGKPLQFSPHANDPCAKPIRTFIQVGWQDLLALR